jgi:superfamily II helicase
MASSPIQPVPLAPPQTFDAATTPASSGRKRKIKEEDNDVDKVPAKKKMARKQCIVCADDVARNQFSKFPHKQDAEGRHSSDVCKKCCSEHLSHEAKNKDHEGVSCPQCSKLLEQSDVQNLASSRTYQEVRECFA